MPRSPIICVCDFRILAMCVVVFGAAVCKCWAGGSVLLVGPLQLSQNRFHRRSTHSYSYFFLICTGHKLRSHIHSFKMSVREFIAGKKYAPAIAALVFVVGYSNLTIPFRLLNIPLSHAVRPLQRITSFGRRICRYSPTIRWHSFEKRLRR